MAFTDHSDTKHWLRMWSRSNGSPLMPDMIHNIRSGNTWLSEMQGQRRHIELDNDVLQAAVEENAFQTVEEWAIVLHWSFAIIFRILIICANWENGYSMGWHYVRSSSVWKFAEPYCTVIERNNFWTEWWQETKHRSCIKLNTTQTSVGP